MKTSSNPSLTLTAPGGGTACEIEKVDEEEKENLAAIKRNPYNIEHLENPSDLLQHAALSLDCYSLGVINNPSETMQLFATGIVGTVIRYIDAPSDAVQLCAVSQTGSAILYIENPCEAAQIKAVEQDGYNISYIAIPTASVVAAAIRTTPEIMFDVNKSNKLTSAALDEVHPGLAAQVEVIKALEADDVARVALFTAWYVGLKLNNESEPKSTALPDNVTL